MAKKQDILLIEDVLKLGNMGDVVKVAPGYARNYLFTHSLAKPASGAAKRQIDVLREKAAKNEGEREVTALAQKKSFEGLTVQVPARVAHEIELFGSIGTKEIVAALAKSGIDVDGKQIHLAEKIHRLGAYQVEVKLHKKVSVTVKVEVVNSDPNAASLTETLAAYEAEKAAKAAAAKAAKEAGANAPAEEAKADDKADAAKSEKPAKGDKKADAAKGDKKADATKGDKKADATKGGKTDKPAKKQKA